MDEIKLEHQRNAITHKAHRKQGFWQITFPLILGTLAVLALGVWAILAAVQGSDVSQSADASLVFLLIPIMVMAVLPLILLAGLSYGIIMINKNLPEAAFKVQQVMVKVLEGVKTGADKVVEPVLRISSAAAALQVFKRNDKKS